MVRILLLLMWTWLPVSRAHGQTDEAEAPTLESLIADAIEGELHLEPAWIKLLHYRKTLTGWKSDADGPDFFLAEQGRRNPARELEATLRGFNRPPTPDELRGNIERMNEEGELPPLQHPVCRFPARLYWLSTQLDLRIEHLAVQDCPKFAEYLALMEPTGASLVFSSYYAENPASIFGHTLLRIHRKSDAEGKPMPALIDHGVNFGAVVGEDKGVRYILKGLTGLYPGRYSRIGYYIKVRQYNDHDSRDLWSYPLDLTPEQTWILVAHLYELDNTWFAYFFRTENCSYQIISLLEAAYPELDILPHRAASVSPLGTIIDSMKNEGLIGEPEMSPALRKQFRARVGALDRQANKTVALLQNDPQAALPGGISVQEQAAILDAAADLVEVRNPEAILVDEPTPEAEIRQQILSRRAQLGVASPALNLSPATLEDPTEGHRQNRLTVEGGADLQRQTYGQLQYRIALHDWADPSLGYPELEEIEFMPTRIRISPNTRELRLEEMTAVRIRSLQPLDRFHQAPSKALEGGLLRAEARGCGDCLAARFQTASGLALSTPTQGWVWFLMSQASLWAIPDLPGMEQTPIHIGIGGTSGVRIRLGAHAVALFEWETMYYPAQAPDWSMKGEGSVRWGLNPHLALGLHAEHTGERSDAGLQLFTYW